MNSYWLPGQPDSHTAGKAFLEVETSSQKKLFLIAKMNQMCILGLRPSEEGRVRMSEQRL